MKTKKKNTENNALDFDFGVDNKKINTKIVLIRYWMAEKGKDSEQFDNELRDQFLKSLEKMYKRYVPADIRKMNETFDITPAAIANIVQAQQESEDTNEQG